MSQDQVNVIELNAVPEIRYIVAEGGLFCTHELTVR